MIYTHKKSGNKYVIIKKATMKVEGTWIPAVVYMAEDSADGKLFVRSEISFNEKFSCL
jgi:hypothetical protein